MTPNAEERLWGILGKLLPEVLDLCTRPVLPEDRARMREMLAKIAYEQEAAADATRDYIEQWAHAIYVRDQVDGEWGSYALSALPPKLAMRHAMRR